MNTKPPKVSCLVVTADRGKLLKRSVHCYKKQTYPNTEFVVVDDGEEDLEDILKVLPSNEIKYIKLKKSSGNCLGKLRNKSLEAATGDFLVQWDDDDWYHPDRISTQIQFLTDGYDACCLSGALIHLDEKPYVNHPYVGYLPNGIPGSIMHRYSSNIRYPHANRAEDTIYLKKWRRKKYIQLQDKYSYLFIRCYHGANTWNKEHFLRRLRNSPSKFVQYFWYAKIKNNLFDHPEFNLSAEEKEAFKMFIEDSKKFGLISFSGSLR